MNLTQPKTNENFRNGEVSDWRLPIQLISHSLSIVQHVYSRRRFENACVRDASFPKNPRRPPHYAE